MNSVVLAIYANNSLFLKGVHSAHSVIYLICSKMNSNCSTCFAFALNNAPQPARHSLRKFKTKSCAHWQKNSKEPCRALNSSPSMYLQFGFIASSFKVCPLLLTSSRCRFYRLSLRFTPQRLALAVSARRGRVNQSCCQDRSAQFYRATDRRNTRRAADSSPWLIYTNSERRSAFKGEAFRGEACAECCAEEAKKTSRAMRDNLTDSFTRQLGFKGCFAALQAHGGGQRSRGEGGRRSGRQDTRRRSRRLTCNTDT